MNAIEELNLSTEATTALTRFLRARIDYKAKQLESPDLSERDTAVIRGALQELRHLLADQPPHVAPLRYSGHTRGSA